MTDKMREEFEAKFPLPSGVAWKDSIGMYEVVDVWKPESSMTIGRYNWIWEGWQACSKSEVSETERLRMQLVACGVVASSNTHETAERQRDMHPDYMSASCQDVIRAVDREMDLREERDLLRTENTVLRKDAELYQQVQIAAGSLPSCWEIALRVENGCGGVDLIDPYGEVVDLDNADESLSESVASAVAFAVAKDGSNG